MWEQTEVCPESQNVMRKKEEIILPVCSSELFMNKNNKNKNKTTTTTTEKHQINTASCSMSETLLMDVDVLFEGEHLTQIELFTQHRYVMPGSLHKIIVFLIHYLHTCKTKCWNTNCR